MSGKSGEVSPAGDRFTGTLSEEVTFGRLEGLRALRDVIAREIETGPVGEKAVSQTAGLARQLRDVLRDIEALEKLVPKGSVVDDLASRRTSRRSSGQGVGEPEGSGGVVRSGGS